MPTSSGCELSRVTVCPRSWQCNAMVVPVRPVKTLVMQRTRSMGTVVLPAVMRIFIARSHSTPAYLQLRQMLAKGLLQIREQVRHARLKESGVRVEPQLLQVLYQQCLGLRPVPEHEVNPGPCFPVFHRRHLLHLAELFQMSQIRLERCPLRGLDLL